MVTIRIPPEARDRSEMYCLFDSFALSKRSQHYRLMPALALGASLSEGHVRLPNKTISSWNVCSHANSCVHKPGSRPCFGVQVGLTRHQLLQRVVVPTGAVSYADPQRTKRAGGWRGLVSAYNFPCLHCLPERITAIHGRR